MSYSKKIEYEVTPKDSFRVIRNCPKCGRKTQFHNTKKFRVNANGNRLDIWLIYQCGKCGQRFNLAIYERRKVSSIPKEEYRRFLANDEELAELYGRDIQLFQKNRADVMEHPSGKTGCRGLRNIPQPGEIHGGEGGF